MFGEGYYIHSEFDFWAWFLAAIFVTVISVMAVKSVKRVKENGEEKVLGKKSSAFLTAGILAFFVPFVFGALILQFGSNSHLIYEMPYTVFEGVYTFTRTNILGWFVIDLNVVFALLLVMIYLHRKKPKKAIYLEILRFGLILALILQIFTAWPLYGTYGNPWYWNGGIEWEWNEDITVMFIFQLYYLACFISMYIGIRLELGGSQIFSKAISPEDKALFERLVAFGTENGYNMPQKKPRTGFFRIKEICATGNGVNDKEVYYAIGQSDQIHLTFLEKCVKKYDMTKCAYLGRVLIYMKGNNPEADLLYHAFYEQLSKSGFVIKVK